LVEVLVAMGVLALLIVMVAQLVNNTAEITMRGDQQMDADREARFVLNRMELDFASLVKRSDVDFYIAKNQGNDQIAFFCECPGYPPAEMKEARFNTQESLAGYRVNQNQLERLSKALVWNGADAGGAGEIQSMVFLPKKIVATWPGVINAGDPTDYESFAPNVFRFEVCFLRQADLAATPPRPLPVLVADAPPIDEISAVVVSLAIADRRSRTMMGESAGVLAGIATKLRDPSSGELTQTPASVWRKQLTAEDFGVPKKALEGVRVYERYFSIKAIH